MQTQRWILTGVFLSACWTSKAEPVAPVVGNTAEVTAERDLSGTFWCTIGEGDYEYEQYPCVIKTVYGKQMLAKLSGSQRFRGFVKPAGPRNFAFDGEMYCPWGDCTEPMKGTFKAVAGGGFKGTFRAQRITVKLTPGDLSAFGGSAYGGDGYGDPFGFTGTSSYGGGGYGGFGYGGWGNGGP